MVGPSSTAFRKCLHELRCICGAEMVLPTSYALTGSLQGVSSLPFAPGGFGDVCEGILDGTRVSVKRVRVCSKDGPEAATKVHYRWRYVPCSPSLTTLTDPPPGSCSVETPGAPEHRPPPRCHPHSSPACLGVDARRGPDGVCQEKRKRGPTYTCMCSSVICWRTLTQLPAVRCR